MLAFLGKAVISVEECCMPNIVHGTVVVFRFHAALTRRIPPDWADPEDSSEVHRM